MKLTILPPKANDELSVNAKGGTELMFQGLIERLDPNLLEHFQIIPSRVRNLDPKKKKILWLHDLPMDPEAQHLKDPNLRKRFDGLVFVSNWQMQAYNWILGVPYSESIVIPNAIVPIPKHTKPDCKQQINLIYHTTPHRGLELLIPVYEELYEEFKETFPGINLHLDVYSSFKIYGWDQRDEPYRVLFQKCIDHPAITYHGTVSNPTIRVALQKAHIFAYPSIWMETSCIALIEALSAGCYCIHPNLAALGETGKFNPYMYQWNENPEQHKKIFKKELKECIELQAMFGMSYNKNLRNSVNKYHDFNTIKNIWESYLWSKVNV
jgi:UDP-glucose:(glucosyl)LPS alpha-1,2-glucosyltransferase